MCDMRGLVQGELSRNRFPWDVHIQFGGPMHGVGAAGNEKQAGGCLSCGARGTCTWCNASPVCMEQWYE